MFAARLTCGLGGRGGGGELRAARCAQLAKSLGAHNCALRRARNLCVPNASAPGNNNNNSNHSNH